MDVKYYKPAEAAAYWNVSRETARRYVRSGFVSAKIIKQGRRVVYQIPESEVKRIYTELFGA